MSPTAVRDDDASASSRPFFDQMCGPFFLAFRVLGVCPYTRNRNGVFRKRVASVSAVYTLCSGVAFGYVNVAAALAFIRRSPHVAVSDFNAALIAFGSVAFFTPSLVVPVIMWFETNKIQTYLQEWQVFQDRYGRVIGKLDGTVADIEKRANKIFRSILVSLTIISVVISWMSTVNDIPLIVCAMKSISTMAFVTGFWYVGTMVMETTNEYYKNKLQTDLVVHAHAIEDYRLLWTQMSKLVHGSGNYMSGTITFCIFYTTVAVILTAYTLTVWGVTLAKLNCYKALASAAAVFVCNSTSLYIYCDRGYSQTKKITLFLNALNQYQPNVDVAGFYQINRGLFGSILSLLVTYFIVLVQLNSSFTTTSSINQINMTTEPELHNRTIH